MVVVTLVISANTLLKSVVTGMAPALSTLLGSFETRVSFACIMVLLRIGGRADFSAVEFNILGRTLEIWLGMGVCSGALDATEATLELGPGLYTYQRKITLYELRNARSNPLDRG